MKKIYLLSFLILHFALTSLGGEDNSNYNLANSYMKGTDGVKQDYKKAVKYFKQAAEQGYADAQCGLAICYYEGYGIAKNQKEALSLMEKSAKQGYARAKRILGDWQKE